MRPGDPLLPRYGQRSLAEVAPSLLSGLGLAGPNPLDVPDARAACLLLVDGLGAELLAAHPADAPVLTELARGTAPITAGFPSSTSVGLASIGTGTPPGRHGITGIAMAPTGGDGELLNTLRWCAHGTRDDRREQYPPERVQPQPTMLERAATAGLAATVLAPPVQRESGLTRAALRGGTFAPTYGLGDLAAGIVDALGGGRAFCYAYHGDLDLLGHVYGPGSLPWRLQLGHVDRLVGAVLELLPAGALLAVVADHGMVRMTDLVDADAEPALRAGVRLLGGDARARHVHAEPGAAVDVLAAWRGVLGARAWVLPRAEAVAAGWFGAVDPAVLRRIGDVVVAARGELGVVRRTAEPLESSLRGAHGSLTVAEQSVPFLLAGPR